MTACGEDPATTRLAPAAFTAWVFSRTVPRKFPRLTCALNREAVRDTDSFGLYAFGFQPADAGTAIAFVRSVPDCLRIRKSASFEDPMLTRENIEAVLDLPGSRPIWRLQYEPGVYDA